jgi:hypothetical protein
VPASRPQGSRYLKVWFHHACSTTILPSWSPLLEHRPQNSRCPRVWFSPCACSSSSAFTGKQAPGLPLTAAMSSLCLQQLPWLLEAYTPTQVDPRASTALWEPDDSSPAAHPQLATQCQEPTTKHASSPRLHAFLFCWCQEASFPTEHGGPALTKKASCGKAPTAQSKSRNLTPPLSGNLPFCGFQETCFPKAQKYPVLPNVPNHGKAPLLH